MICERLKALRQALRFISKVTDAWGEVKEEPRTSVPSQGTPPSRNLLVPTVWKLAKACVCSENLREHPYTVTTY